jgi:osmotically-inducible protein OsmY
VGSPWERALAEDITRSARGVRNVKNYLDVRPFEMAVDEQMSHQIRRALSESRGLRDADVHVAVNDGTVVLSGEVDHLWQKETAQSVTGRFRPMRLQNDIVVRRHTS